MSFEQDLPRKEIHFKFVWEYINGSNCENCEKDIRLEPAYISDIVSEKSFFKYEHWCVDCYEDYFHGDEEFKTIKNIIDNRVKKEKSNVIIDLELCLLKTGKEKQNGRNRNTIQ
jgi:hypothetical protein